MNRPYSFITIFFLFLGVILSAQEEEPKPQKESPVDSLTTDLKKKGVVVQEATFERREINPLAPSKAAFYSAILPGLGQLYNKRYWKAPIVWGAMGLGIATYSARNTEYNSFRDAFKRRRAGFTDDQFYDVNGDGVGPDFSDAALQDAQESTQRNRDLALVITIGLYALNVIDANVDAHLKQYNVDDRLGIDIKPYFDFDPINTNPNYGLALTIEF
ncbi:DUF5683 domain-containing protein [uncultured Croceitalea sp.]|uniref:DUF5683 domain-containing protein n=1 Tax=uncultured Croceitalea sp. TaxID=1798908 RepID=UPI003306233B